MNAADADIVACDMWHALLAVGSLTLRYSARSMSFGRGTEQAFWRLSNRGKVAEYSAC